MTETQLSAGVSLRAARPEDAAAVARLHATRIAEGFLPTLGERFLTRLYRRIVRSRSSCAYVVDHHSNVVAFAAGTLDLGALYREFVVRDGVAAAIGAARHLRRAWRPALETLRYPKATLDLPAAEVLAVATSAEAGGRGFGTRAVGAVTSELARRGAPGVKVAVGADNAAALAMYRGCGFAVAANVAIHADTPSKVLVWPAS